MFEEEVIKVKAKNRNIFLLDYKDEIYEAIVKIQDYMVLWENALNDLKCIALLPYIQNISPRSHYDAEHYPVHLLKFRVNFVDNIHSSYITEPIGEEFLRLGELTVGYIEKIYIKFRDRALADLEDEYITASLKQNKLYQNTISELKSVCNETDFLRIGVSSDNRRIILFNNCNIVFLYEYGNQDLFGEFETSIKEIFMEYIDGQIDTNKRVDYYESLINSCRNKVWKVIKRNGCHILLKLIDPTTEDIIVTKDVYFTEINNVEEKIYQTMRGLLDYSETYCGIRFMEVKQ